jgi:hypothetical protein
MFAIARTSTAAVMHINRPMTRASTIANPCGDGRGRPDRWRRLESTAPAARITAVNAIKNTSTRLLIGSRGVVVHEIADNLNARSDSASLTGALESV